MATNRRALSCAPFAWLALATACGRSDAPLMQTTDGSIQLVFSADAKWLQDEGKKEMESALALHADIDLVYAHNDPMARGAQLAAEQAGRTGIRFVGIDALPHEGLMYVAQGKLDATVEYPTGGAEAVDLAVLLLNGIEVPKDIVLGTKLYTRANIEQGGEAVAASGDKVIADLRREHRKLLEEPVTDHVWRIGMSQCNNAEPWRMQMNADIRERVAKYSAQLELVLKDAQNNSSTQRHHIEELVAEGVVAILVSPKESVALIPAVDAAMARGIVVVVLDRKLGSDNYTCFLGGDNVAIGRVAAGFIRECLVAGGRIVEIKGLMTSSPAQERHQGFVEGLGLEAAR